SKQANQREVFRLTNTVVRTRRVKSSLPVERNANTFVGKPSESRSKSRVGAHPRDSISLTSSPSKQAAVANTLQLDLGSHSTAIPDKNQFLAAVENIVPGGSCKRCRADGLLCSVLYKINVPAIKKGSQPCYSKRACNACTVSKQECVWSCLFEPGQSRGLPHVDLNDTQAMHIFDRLQKAPTSSETKQKTLCTDDSASKSLKNGCGSNATVSPEFVRSNEAHLPDSFCMQEDVLKEHVTDDMTQASFDQLCAQYVFGQGEQQESSSICNNWVGLENIIYEQIEAMINVNNALASGLRLSVDTISSQPTDDISQPTCPETQVQVIWRAESTSHEVLHVDYSVPSTCMLIPSTFGVQEEARTEHCINKSTQTTFDPLYAIGQAGHHDFSSTWADLETIIHRQIEAMADMNNLLQAQFDGGYQTVVCEGLQPFQRAPDVL
ncbi:hypothetical protein CVT26_009580, partial [Gymnopilus dilepis]